MKYVTGIFFPMCDDDDLTLILIENSLLYWVFVIVILFM